MLLALFTWQASAMTAMTRWDGRKMAVLSRGDLLEICEDASTSKEAALKLMDRLMSQPVIEIDRNGVLITAYEPYHPGPKTVTELTNGQVSVCLTVVKD